MLPMRPIGGENAMTKQSPHSTNSGSEAKVVELSRQNRLDVLRLTRHDQRPAHEAECLRVPIRRQVAVSQALEHSSLKSILLENPKLVDPQHRIALAPWRSWFASHLPLELVHADYRHDPSSYRNDDDECQSDQTDTVWIHYARLE